MQKKYDPYTGVGGGEAVHRNCLEEAQILVFLDKDFTLTTINIFKELKGSLSKEVKESVRKGLIKWRIQINTIF